MSSFRYTDIPAYSQVFLSELLQKVATSRIL